MIRVRGFALFAALSAVAGFGTATIVDAKTFSKTVSTGRSTKIDHYTGWNDDCSFLDISIDIVTKPAHGTVTPRIASGRIGQAQIGKSGACLGKPTKVLELYYKSAPGYRGADAMSVDMRTPTSAPVRFDYDITVR